MNHILHGSRDAPCHKDCCFVCEGGLADCVICHGAEAALPTECPGRALTGKEMDEIQADKLDYNNAERVMR